MSRRSNSPVRLVVALTVAAMLAMFLLYTSMRGNATPSLQPSQLDGRTGLVTLSGAVVGPIRGDANGSGLRFRLRDVNGRAWVAVVYHGSIPDLFRRGRHVLLRGRLRGGTFIAVRDSLMTKCPSRYAPKRSGSG